MSQYYYFNYINFFECHNQFSFKHPTIKMNIWTHTLFLLLFYLCLDSSQNSLNIPKHTKTKRKSKNKRKKDHQTRPWIKINFKVFSSFDFFFHFPLSTVLLPWLKIFRIRSQCLWFFLWTPEVTQSILSSELFGQITTAVIVKVFFLWGEFNSS